MMPAYNFYVEGYCAMSEKKKPIVVGIGEILWDMLPGGRRAGGAPINFVYHTAALGAEGYAISAVGNDQDGDEILLELEKSKIAHFIARVPYPTGKVLVELKDGIPSYTIVEDVAWDHIPAEKQALDLIRRADAVCFGTLASRNAHSRQNITRLLEAAAPQALKFFDINLRGSYYSPELIRRLLEFANVFKINDEELPVIRRLLALDGSDDEVCHTLMKQYGLRYLIFTAGENYSIIYSPQSLSYLKTPKVCVADTVGAGDAFSGAFVYGILTGKTMEEAHRDAVRISAFVCTRSGAWPEYTPDLKG